MGTKQRGNLQKCASCILSVKADEITLPEISNKDLRMKSSKCATLPYPFIVKLLQALN